MERKGSLLLARWKRSRHPLGFLPNARDGRVSRPFLRDYRADGRFSFSELDILFANKVPARQFKKVVIKDMPIQAEGVEQYDRADLEEKINDEQFVENARH